MNELRIEAKARNNVLYNYIFNNYSSVAHFCNESGFSQQQIGYLLNLKRSPKNKKGEWTEYAVKLAKFFNTIEEYLFPIEIYNIKETNAVIEIGIDELPCFGYGSDKYILDKIESDQLKSAFNKLFAGMKEREVDILKCRHGFDGINPMTLGELANKYNVTNETIRQLEWRALSRLRRHDRSKYLKEFY